MAETLTGPRARQAVDYFQSQGWPLAQAAGIVANLHAESGLDEDENRGDGGLAYGIGQWWPDRQKAFQAWAGYPIQGSSFEKQLEFVHHELTQGGEQAAGKALSAADGPRAAGMTAANEYERPHDPDGFKAVQRGRMAQQLYDTLQAPAAQAST